MQHLRTLRREFLMLNYRLILGPDVGRPGASSTLSHIPYRCPVKRNSLNFQQMRGNLLVQLELGSQH